MTKATDITTAIFARLQTIRTANGYLTNVGAVCFRSTPDNLPEDAGLPAVVLYSQTDADIGGNRQTRKHSRAYVIEALLSATGEYDAHQDDVLYDLRRALSDPTGLTMGGAAVEIRTGTAVLDDPEIGSELAIVRLPVTVDYTENYLRG